MKKILRIIDNNLFMLKYIARYTPSLLIFNIIDAVVFAGLYAVPYVIFVKLVFDRLEKGTVESFKQILIICAWMVLFFIVFKFMYFWYWEYHNQKLRHILRRGMQTELFRKACEIDISCYDDPKFYDSFIWASQQSDQRALSILNNINWLLNAVIYVGTVVGLVITVNLYAAVIILFMSIFDYIIWVKKNKIYMKRMEEQMTDQRRLSYVERVFYLNDYAKEMRLCNLETLFFRNYSSTVKSLKQSYIKYAKKLILFNFLQSMSDLISICSVNAIMIRGLVNSTISLGDFGATHAASFSLRWRVSNIMWTLSEFPKNSMFVEKFREFIEYQPKIKGGETIASKFDNLSINNLYFRYDGNNENTLNDISLDIKRGEKIALVGYNGAGKSTLIKLIMRLYDPINGGIYLNGKNNSEYTLESYRGHIAAVFQDYRIFAATIAENVLADEYDDSRKEEVLHALHYSNFDDKLRELKKGIYTPLTREFEGDGTNLSGGEAQKIAIARVFACNSDLIILDEPSSALDPISEYELNRSIKEYAHDKTVIFISHRLSTTRMADRIYMLEQGRIIEWGTHDELISMNGKYAEMFNLQAEKYRLSQGESIEI